MPQMPLSPGFPEKCHLTSQLSPRLGGTTRYTERMSLRNRGRVERTLGGCNEYEQLLRKEITMNLLNLFKSFKNDESGAVTVDWVVLTAAVVGLTLALMTAIRPALTGTAANIATQITAAGTAIAP
jgi:Flp pilus assembly pilin Flp